MEKVGPNGKLFVLILFLLNEDTVVANVLLQYLFLCS